MKVEWIGARGIEEYHGKAGTGDDAEELHLLPGEVVEVSDEQAAYLSATFPEHVSVGGQKSSRRRKRGEEPEAEDAGEPEE